MDSVSGDWMTGDITFEEPLFRPDCPPVVAQDFQQPGREHDVPVFLSLAQFHMYDHPLTVDIIRLQVDRFGDAQSGGVTGGQDRAMLQAADAIEKVKNLLRAEDHGKLLRLLGRRNDFLNKPLSFERDLIEEAEGGDGRQNRSGASFLSFVR